MSIAASSLLIIAALIPGIAFLNAYFSGKFPRQLANLSPLAELALYFFWALPIDAVALHLLRQRIAQVCSAIEHLLSQPSGHLPTAASALTASWWWPWLWWYIVIVVSSFVIGALVRRIVWASRIDLLIPVLRLKAEWYYVLLGRRAGLPWDILPEADVLTKHPEGSRLYSGVVDGLEPSKEGDIETLYLIAAQRHKKFPDGITRQVPIPGETLVIRGTEIHSINMRFHAVPVAPGWAGFRHRLWSVIRAFLLED